MASVTRPKDGAARRPIHTAKNRKNSGGLTPWPKGQSGNPKGRPAGVPNKATAEGKAFFLGLVNDPGYQARFREAFVHRRVKPQVEIMVWHYAYGKPKTEATTESGTTLLDILEAMARESSDEP